MRGNRRARTEAGFRSKYEERIFNNATERGRVVVYEQPSSTLRYTKPSTVSRYTPDFILPNGILVESKGYLTAEDRGKMLLVVQCNPEVDIRFLFQRGGKRITKNPNSMTYEEWAERNGFKWAVGESIPDEWFDEEKKDS